MKTKIAFLLAFGILACGSLVMAGSYGEGWSIVEAPASSGVVVGNDGSTAGSVAVYGRARVRAVYASSDTANLGGWFVLIDTAGLTPALPGIAAFADGRWKSPPMNFPYVDVGTVAVNGAIYKMVEYGPEGVVFSSGVYVFKSAATSGQARRVFVEIKQ